jgi:hypothetical protein
MHNLWKRLNLPAWTVPLVLLALCLLSFGLLIPWLGYYWDDWAKISVSRLFGLSGYWAYYAEDRPLSSWTHILLTPILGYRPIFWHIFALLLRWLSACGLWWSLSGLWPHARRQNAFTAMLFVVYPVFLQQPIAVTFHQQWLQFAFYFLSLGAMIQAYRRPQRFLPYTLLAVVAMLLQLSITEYFAPIELIRPLVLWLLVSPSQPDWRQRAATALRQWAPYLLLLTAYVIWRLFFIQLPGEDPYRAETLYRFLEQPLATLIDLGRVMAVDVVYILISSWSKLLEFGLEGRISLFTLVSWAVALFSAIFSVVYLVRLRDSEPEEYPVQAAWVRQALALGALATLLGPVPAWITGRQVVFDFHSDRYAMPALFGASLLTVAVVEWLAQRKLQKAALLGALIGLAVGLHLRTANDYRWIWTDQLRFYWELSWRAPHIKAPTAILSEREMFPNQGLFSTSAALNLLYPQPGNADQLAYWAYTLWPKFANHIPEPLQIGFNTTFRSLHFEGSTPNSLLVYNDPSRANCLWVLRPEDSDHPYLSELVKAFLPISNLERIEPVPAAAGYPPTDFYGPEPPHGWCYFFEKADLARQFGDWQRVAALADEARSLGYWPDQSAANSPYEWLPFVEGYARTGRWDDAQEVTLASHEQDAQYRLMLCRLWASLEKDYPDDPDGLVAAQEVFARLECSQ